MAIKVLVRVMLMCSFIVCGAINGNPMNVTATVASTCEIGTITDTDFGTISGLFQFPVATATGSITIMCTPTSVYMLSIDPGGNPNPISRRMTDGTSFIQYSLYQNAAYSILWGDGANFGPPLTAIGDGIPHTFPVYATIPSGQIPVEPGFYADVVMVSFSF